MLETLVVAGGVAAGCAIGSRMRQAAHDRVQAGAATHAPDVARNVERSGNRDAAGGVGPFTVMLAGDSTVGKTLFLQRVTNREGISRETLPKTVVPAWQRLDLTLPTYGRTHFQLLDTPGGLPELSVVFYHSCDAVVLMFDVGNAASFARVQTQWHPDVQQHRLSQGKHRVGTCVVLAHVVDERRERQVTRREASSWCGSVGLPYYETHPADSSGWVRMLAHLASVALSEEVTRGRGDRAAAAT